MATSEHAYADAGALADALADALHATLRDALATRGHASLALGGGRTPLPTYRRLAAMPLEWSRVHLMPTDERCVPHDHPACNVAELRQAFASAQGVAIESLTVADGDPQRSEAHARAMLATHAEDFDAIVLGMGPDAHTASLFPGATQLAHALSSDAPDACRVDPDTLPPEAPFPRITLTLPRLLRARTVHLAITGEAKRDVLRAAQASTDVMAHPIAAVLRAPGAAVQIHWSP
jgi:6-phosphogluconolactonase